MQRRKPRKRNPPPFEDEPRFFAENGGGGGGGGGDTRRTPSPLLRDPFILKVLKNNWVLRGTTRVYDLKKKQKHVRFLYGFCTGVVCFLPGFF